MTIENGPPYKFGRDFFPGKPVRTRFFTCARCGLSFQTMTSEAEANREFLESGQPMDGSDIKSVCDDCYEEVMTWAREKGMLE